MEGIRSYFQDPRGRWLQFLKKRHFSQWKKILASFFLVLPCMADLTSSNKILRGSTWYFGSHFPSCKILFVTPMRLLKIQFLKKATHPVKKRFGPLLIDFIENDRPYGTSLYKIHDSDVAMKGLSCTHERVFCVLERLDF